MERLRQLGPLSGLAAFVLFGVGNALWALDTPRLDAQGPELVRFYANTSTRIIVGAGLSVVSITLFAWFGSVLRERLERLPGAPATGLPLAVFGGVLLAAAAGLGAETINMAGALRARDEAGITPDAAQAYFDISQILGFNAAGVGLAAVLAGTAALAIAARALLPRWLAVAMLVIAVSLLTPLVRITFTLAFLILPVISLLLYRERATLQGDG